MMRIRLRLGLVVVIALGGMVLSHAQSKTAAPAAAPVIVLTTAKGTIEIETFPQDAPKAVAHVLELVRRGFYRGLRFHWVQPSAVQIGDPMSRDMSKMASWGAGHSGSTVGVAEIFKRNFVRGIVGLFYRAPWTAKDSDCEFFILRQANPTLDGKYIAIGRVTKGMDVADKVEMADVLSLASVKGDAPK